MILKLARLNQKEMEVEKEIILGMETTTGTKLLKIIKCRGSVSNKVE